MDNSVPIEDEIEGAVKCLRNHRSGGILGMRSEHLKGWLAAARKKEKEEAEAGKETTDSTKGGEVTETTYTEASNWAMVVELVQKSFREGQLAAEATWQAMVLLTKGGKYYCGIGLVEVMWKVVAAILNRRLAASITFHDFLHRFWAGRGTGTATLEAKLLQKLAALRE